MSTRCLFAAVVCAAFAVVVAWSPRSAAACSCAESPEPCESMWSAAAVFAGKVEKIETVTNKKGGVERKRVTFRVSEVLRGKVGKTAVVETSGDDGSCGYSFADGSSYLVYAGEHGGVFSTGLCSRTRPLAEAQADLDYAHNKPKRKAAVVEGTVKLENPADSSHNETRYDVQPGVEIRARGTNIKAISDKRGRYRLELPPGNYTLEGSGKGVAVRWDRLPELSVPDAAACARRDIVMVIDGHIRGRITDSAGKPLANVHVSAEAAPDTRQPWRLDASTDADGRYDIPQVPPGRFFVGVSADLGSPSAESPYPTTFYPGTGNKEKARAVKIGRSATVGSIDFKVPAPLKVYTLTGVVRWPDGKPAKEVMLSIDHKTQARGAGVPTDASGNFTYKDIAGSRLGVRACGERDGKEFCIEKEYRLDADGKLDLTMQPVK